MGLILSRTPEVGLSVNSVEGFAEYAGVQPMDLVIAVGDEIVRDMCVSGSDIS